MDGADDAGYNRHTKTPGYQPGAYDTPAVRSGSRNPQPSRLSARNLHTAPQSNYHSQYPQPAQSVAYNTPEEGWSGTQDPHRQPPSSSTHHPHTTPQSSYSSQNLQPAHPVAYNTPEARPGPHNPEAPQPTWPGSGNAQPGWRPVATSGSQPDGQMQANPGGFVGYQQQWSPAQVALGEPQSRGSTRQIDHAAPGEPQGREYAR